MIAVVGIGLGVLLFLIAVVGLAIQGHLDRIARAMEAQNLHYGIEPIPVMAERAASAEADG